MNGRKACQLLLVLAALGASGPATAGGYYHGGGGGGGYHAVAITAGAITTAAGIITVAVTIMAVAAAGQLASILARVLSVDIHIRTRTTPGTTLATILMHPCQSATLLCQHNMWSRGNKRTWLAMAHRKQPPGITAGSPTAITHTSKPVPQVGRRCRPNRRAVDAWRAAFRSTRPDPVIRPRGRTVGNKRATICTATRATGSRRLPRRAHSSA